MIGKGIFSRLTTDTAVAALVSTRVYPELSPEQRDFPCIVYALEESDHLRSYGGETGLVSATVRIISIATTYAELDDLGEKVRASLDNQSGTWGSVVVLGAFFEGESDDVITVADDAAARYYLKEQTYLIWHRP